MTKMIALLTPTLTFRSNPKIQTLISPTPTRHNTRILNLFSLNPKPKTLLRFRTTTFTSFADKNDNSDLEKDREAGIESDGGDGAAEEGDDDKGGWRRLVGGIRWRDLLVSSDPDNIVAVGLTGLLTWASVQVLWQLVFISLAILVAAVKYSLIAALLVFILITLL